MAQTEFQGSTYTLSHATNNLVGLLDVKVVQTGGEPSPPIEVTTKGDSVYTYIADSLGSKGGGKTTLTATFQVSSVYEATNYAQLIALNVGAELIFIHRPATTTGNVMTMTMELVSRVTTIPLKGICTAVYVFEATGAPVWTSPVVA